MYFKVSENFLENHTDSGSRKTIYLLSIDHKRFQSTSRMHFMRKCNDSSKLMVLEPVTEQTEWVNSYVIVEKEVEISTANAHSPSHTIKKKIRLCLDPKDLNISLE